MNAYQSDRKNMFFAVDAHLKGFPTIVGSSVLLINASNRLSAITAQIMVLNGIQETTTRGATIEKFSVRQQLVLLTMGLGSASWAVPDRDASASLRLQSGVTESFLNRLSATRFSGYTKALLTLAQEHIPFLEVQGFTYLNLASYETLVSLWEDTVVNPRKAISRRSAATREMAILFKQGNVILRKRLDNVMKAFRTTDPEFYFGYRSARIVVNTGSRKPKGPGKKTEAGGDAATA